MTRKIPGRPTNSGLTWLFTGSLFDRFNSYAVLLWAFEAYFCHVKEMSRLASTAKESQRWMHTKKEQRHAELEGEYRTFAMRLTASLASLPVP